jgi:hypothetical protein
MFVMAEAQMRVTEQQAASMYARACRAWYGRRATKVVGDTLKRLRAANDKSGVRVWMMIAEALPDARAQHTDGRPRHFD